MLLVFKQTITCYYLLFAINVLTNLYHTGTVSKVNIRTLRRRGVIQGMLSWGRRYYGVQANLTSAIYVKVCIDRQILGAPCPPSAFTLRYQE